MASLIGQRMRPTRDTAGAVLRGGDEEEAGSSSPSCSACPREDPHWSGSEPPTAPRDMTEVQPGQLVKPEALDLRLRLGQVTAADQGQNTDSGTSQTRSKVTERSIYLNVESVF